MKIKHYLNTAILATCTLFPFATQSTGEVLYSDNFDLEAPDEGSPDNFLSFGTCLTSIVVNTRNSASPPNAAILTLEFAEGRWGGGMIRHKFEPTNFEGATLSMNFAASQDLSDKRPLLSFRAEDEDGTIMRANISQMFSPGTVFKEFSLPITNLTQLDARGADSMLNLEKIVSYGFCVYNNADVEGVVHFYIDDFVASKPGDDEIAITTK